MGDSFPLSGRSHHSQMAGKMSYPIETRRYPSDRRNDENPHYDLPIADFHGLCLLASPRDRSAD
jgi:hypothetical protein